MSLDQWSRTAADNDDATKDAMVEGMDRDQVNDKSRDQQAALRTWYEDAEWVDLLQESHANFTVARANTTDFNVLDDEGSNATDKFPLGMWVKVTGTGSPTVAFGFVSAVSAYAASQITVTLGGIYDETYAASTLPSATVTQVECYIGRSIKQAAFHPVGTTLVQAPEQIPTIDQLGNGVTKDEGSGNGYDADTVDGKHAADFVLSGASSANAITNSGFQIWQRGTSFTTPANASYTADRWAILGEAALWDVDRESTSLPTGFRRAIRLTANGTTASPASEKVGILQILTADDSREIIDAGVCSLSYQCLMSNAYSIDQVRAGILEWTGTEDSPTTDVVSTWNAENTDPTLAISWAYANTPSVDALTVKSASWQTGTVENVAISGSAVNIAVFIWVDDKTFNNGDILRIGGVQLEANATAATVRPRRFPEELALCLPFYQTTYDYGVAAGTNPNEDAGRIEHAVSRHEDIGGNDAIMDWRFQVPMFKTPTVTPYAPGTGNSGHATGSGDGDLNCSAINPGTSGVTFQVTENPTVQALSVHGVAEAEL